MGYARYEVIRNGERIEAGYAVEAPCEEDGCTTQIDRGIGFLCGRTPGGDENGCGGYYCDCHLFGGNQCTRCVAAADARRLDEAAHLIASILKADDRIKDAAALADEPHLYIELADGEQVIARLGHSLR